MIPILGIVGGIGSGKSAVARALESLGGYLINADALGHEALEDPPIKAKLIERWGNGVLDAAGKADRKKIGRMVFSDVDELQALEALVFPYIEGRILEEIARGRRLEGVKYIILDAAIMIETGWHRHCDKLLFVDAPRDVRLARLKATRGWTEEELKRRERVQLPLEEKKQLADAVIVNDGETVKILPQVKDVLVSWKMI
jgi:dephospho-CoA kinase